MTTPNDLFFANVLLDSVGSLLVVLLLFGARMSTSRGVRPEQKLLQLMTAITLSLCVSDLCANLVNNNPFLFSRSIGYLLNVYYFIVLAVLILLWCIYMELRVHATISHMLGWRGVLVALPACLIIVLAIINLFWDVLFTISVDCIYQRLPMGTAVFWMLLGYVVYSMIRFFVYRYHDKRYTFSPIYMFIVPLAVGCAAQLHDHRISAMAVCIAIGFATMQVMLQNELAFIDPLTGVFNRQFLNNYLQKSIQDVERENNHHKLAGIMMDVNSFKKLNDTYGHLAGDEALQEIGNLLREAVPPTGVATRFGGDEFVVIITLDEANTSEAIVQSIRSHVEKRNKTTTKPYALSLSIGTTYFAKKADTFDSFFKRMDEAMYRNKKATN